ncbi:MAG: ATP-binding cassette domain-containing protein, partial [Nitrospinaceae bacterium]
MKRPRPLARSTPEGSLEDAPLQPLMQAQGLTFAFETTPVLDSLTFSLAPGEVLGIIGPNGSGKSTLLRLAGGLLPSPKGSLQFKGRDLHSYKTRLLAQSIAWVPQESHLPFSFTAGEVVMMGRHPYLSALGFESGEDFHSTA